MPQVKKERVRDAILDAAETLFTHKGYAQTTLAEIAHTAGTSTANIYRYYGSKLELFYAVFGPWYAEQLRALEDEVNDIEDPRARLHRILTGIWHDIPRAGGGFGSSVVEALATASPEDNYSREVLEAAEAAIARLIHACLPPDRQRTLNERQLAHLMFMASDGFALHIRLNDADPPIEDMVELMGNVLLSPAIEQSRC